MKLIKYLLLTIIALISIAVIGISFVDINQFKPDIEKLASEALGRKLSINGDIDVGVLPAPHVAISDIQLANATWAKQKQMLQAKSVRIELAFSSLFKGVVEADKIILNGITVNLETDNKKQKSWDLFPDKIDEKHASESAKSLPLSPNLVVAISDLAIRYDTPEAGQELLLNSLQLTHKNDHSDILIKANYNKTPIKLNIQTVLLHDILATKKLPLDISGTIGKIKTSVKGNIALDQKLANKVKLQWAVQADDLSSLNELLDMQLPEIGKTDISGHLLINAQSIQLSGLKGNVGQTGIQGDAQYITAKTGNKVKLKLQINNPDLVLLQQNKAEKAEEKQQDQALFSDQTFELGALKQLDADIDISISQLQYDITNLKTMTMLATLNNGLLEIKKFDTINERDEKLSATVLFNTQSEPATLKFTIDADNIQAGENKALSKYLTGANTQIHSAISSKGNSVKELMSNLNGQLIIQVGEGTVSSDILGFIGSNILLDLVNAINPLSKSSSTSELECAAVRFDIKDGIATSDKGIAMQTNHIQVISSGHINFKSEDIDFAIKPQAREGIELNLNDLASMVKLGGTIRQPKIAVSLKDTALIASYISTGGTAFLAKSLFETVTRDANPCDTAVKAPEEKNSKTTDNNLDTTKKPQAENDSNNKTRTSNDDLLDL